MREQYKLTDKEGHVIKSGGIVIRQRKREQLVLLVYRSAQADWSFPKGHVEPGETTEETAVREIKEECGIETYIIRKLPPLKYVNNRTRERTVCSMYVMIPVSLKLVNKFPEEKAEWVPVKQVADKLSHQNLRDYFVDVLPIIGQIKA